MSVIDSIEERNEFFRTNFREAQAKYIALSLREEFKVEDIKGLVQGLGVLMIIIEDMRQIDLNQQAEIASLKATLKAKVE